MREIIIATITRPYGETGVQTHINCFREYLDAHALNNRLITPFSYYKFLVYPVFAVRKLLDKLSGELSVWWYRYWHKLFLRLALKQQLPAAKNCILYAQCPVSAHAALQARSSVEQAVILIVHFNISQADEWVGKGYIKTKGALYRSIREFEADILPKLDGLVFVSEFMRRELIERIPAISAVPYAVIPNFLADPGLPAADPISGDLICIGTLENRKNQQYALEILAELHGLGQKLSLTVVGDGPDRTALANTAARLGLTDYVRFTGFVKNAATLMNSHRAYLHVASIENLPVTLLEALARSRPVFALPVGGIPEILGNDTSVGLALPINAADSAAKIIAQALVDQTWLQTAGVAARQRFLENYVSEVTAKRLVTFLQATAEGDRLL